MTAYARLHLSTVALLAHLTCGSACAGPEGESLGPTKIASACAVIVVPGFEGSVLVDEKGVRVWPPQPGSLLWWGLEEDLSIDRSLRATGILLNVPIVPDLIERRVYGPLVDALDAQGCTVISFAYDWRQDLFENAALFAQFVDDGQHHELPIIAHSLGGLIVRVASHDIDLRGPIFYAAVPFKSGLGFLVDVQQGSPLGLRRTFLPGRLLRTFPSTFVIFAEHEARIDGADLFDAHMWMRSDLDGAPQPTGALVESVTLDDWLPAAWLPKGLRPKGALSAGGRAKSDASEAEEARYRREVESAIARAHAARQRLERLPPQAMAQVHVIVGTGRPTPQKAVLGTDGRPHTEETTTDGDGRIVVDDAIPDEAANDRVFLVQAAHSRVLEESDVHAYLQAAIAAHFSGVPADGARTMRSGQNAPDGARPLVPPLDEGSR
jgi:hypothetical protein